jgi:flagellar FliL protein
VAAQPEPPKPPAKHAKSGDAKAPAAAAAGKPAAGGEKPRRRSGKLLALAAVLILLTAGGAGVFIFLSGEESAETSGTADASEQPAVFVPLETFTVNLLQGEGLQQYLQTSVTLKMASQTTADAVKTRMPEVRNRVLLILSAKRPAELMPIAGKEKLASEIGDAIQGIVARPKTAEAAQSAAATAATSAATAGNGNGARPARPVEVLFTAFIIQ